MESESTRMRAVIKDPQHFKRFVETFQLFKLRQDLLDVCFICARGFKVYAHKLLLCSASPLMTKMFLEVPEHLDTIYINMPDIEARIMRLMMQFLYEGSLHVEATTHEELKKVMKMLGIFQDIRKAQREPESPVQQPAPAATPQHQQAVFYMQAQNSQGQMQYVLASPTAQGQVVMAQTAAPGHLMPVTQAANGQLLQVGKPAAPGQIIQVAQPGDQVMQVAAPTSTVPLGQIVQMTPTRGQMVQGTQQVGSTSIQQSNMVQVIPQNNNQVPVMPMVQCSSQMMVQAGQPTIINSNQMQGNVQNQTPTSQRPQYVMASSANQMTTSQARTQYNQPQITPQQRITARSRATAQVAQPIRNNTTNSEDASPLHTRILAILQENCKNAETIETLTARQLRELLEPKLGVDLSDQEELIERVLQSFQGMCGENKNESEPPAASVRRSERPGPASVKATRRRKKRLNLSDDEDDEDFHPGKKPRKPKKK